MKESASERATLLVFEALNCLSPAKRKTNRKGELGTFALTVTAPTASVAELLLVANRVMEEVDTETFRNEIKV
jgi:hypothetical protein